MTISVGSSVVLRTEKIVSVVGYDDSNVEIIMNPVSICFEFNDQSSQLQFMEFIKIAMDAEGEQAKIIADGLKNMPFRNVTTYSNRNIDARLRDIATDIATKN